MHREKIIRPLVIVLATAIAGGIWWYLGSQGARESNLLLLYGNIDIREADLAFNNSEHIDKLLVQEGDRARKGQLLATLHRSRMQAEVTAAEAQVAARKAVVARLETGSRPEEVRQAQANVAAARAKLVDAQITF